jgi:transposase
MLTIGVDAHKQLLVASALDTTGQVISQWQGENRADGWSALFTWAHEYGDQRVWGIEGSGHYGHGLAQSLVAREEVVYEVNPRLTAALRKRNRRRGKSDDLDSQAIAQAVRQEGYVLPQVRPTDATAVVRLLTEEHADLQAEVTRVRNRLHNQLHLLDPAYQQRWGALQQAATLERLTVLTIPNPDPMMAARLGQVRRLARQLLVLEEQRAELARDLEQEARQHYQALTSLSGVGLLTAAMLAGYLGDADRFASDAQVASYAGIAPLETSSAGAVRHRLNRTGNRQLNMLVHRVALTQARCSDEAKAYMARRQAEGKSWREALRALKRYIIRRIWRLWQQVGPRCAPIQPPPLT